MAKATKKAAPAKEEKKAAKKAAPAPTTKMTDAEKAAKKAARKEALKNRPEGQRPNSKQIDEIALENGKVVNFAMPVRKTGSLITSVALDAEGHVVSTSVTLVPGVSPKTKKGHGYLVAKVPGMGKKAKGAAAEVDEDEDDDDEDED